MIDALSASLTGVQSAFKSLIAAAELSKDTAVNKAVISLQNEILSMQNLLLESTSREERLLKEIDSLKSDIASLKNFEKKKRKLST